MQLLRAAAAACVVLLLTALPLVLSQDGSQYPRCPKGGFYPKKVTSPPSRCLDASEYTCCKDCRELWLALRIVSANGTTVLDQISPGLSMILGGKELKVCALMAGHDQCALLLEQMVCALDCNPDSGNYLKNIPGGHEMFVCDGFSDHVYAECNGLSLPGFGTLGSFFPSKEDLFGILVGAIVSSATFSDTGNYTATIVKGTEGCYNGPKVMPAITECCDPLNVPGRCLTDGQVNTTMYPEYIPYINQTRLNPTCKNVALPPSPTEGTPPTSPSTSPSSPQPSPSSTPSPAIPSVSSPPPSPPGPSKPASRGIVKSAMWLVAVGVAHTLLLSMSA